MTNSMLQTLGDLVKIQNKFNMQHFGNASSPGFVLCLLNEGVINLGDSYKLGEGKAVERLKDLAYDCKLIGLEVSEKETDWYNNIPHNKGYYINIRLPTSPALEILYGK